MKIPTSPIKYLRFKFYNFCNNELFSVRKEEGINGKYFSNPFNKIYRLFFSVCLNVKYVGIIIESQSRVLGLPLRRRRRTDPKCFQSSAGNAVISVSPSQTQIEGEMSEESLCFDVGTNNTSSCDEDLNSTMR